MMTASDRRKAVTSSFERRVIKVVSVLSSQYSVKGRMVSRTEAVLPSPTSTAFPALFSDARLKLFADRCDQAIAISQLFEDLNLLGKAEGRNLAAKGVSHRSS